MYNELYKTSLISIDSYENRILTGRISNPFLDADIPFFSTMEFIKEMTTMLEEPEFLQSFFKSREFLPVKGQKCKDSDSDTPLPNTQKGQLATFSLRIMFRQHCSWQGSLSWLEGKQEQHFRSALELLLLIDSALSHIAS